MKKVKLIYEGKAKRVYSTEEDDKFIIEFKDSATAFDGLKKQRFRVKERLIAQYPARYLNYLPLKE